MVSLNLAGMSLSIERRKVRPQTIEGAPGFAVHGGFLDNKETVSSLQGQERYKTFSNILINTAVIGAGVRHFLNLVAKSEWTAQPGEADSAAHQEMADFVMSVIDGMDTSWHRVVRKTALYRFHGFSIQEWTARRRQEDGLIGFKEVSARPQHTIKQWDTDAHGNLLGVVQERPQDHRELYLARGKIIHAFDDSISDIPEGVGLFRHIIEVTNRLRTYERLEGIGFENDLNGVPMFRAPLEELNKSLKDNKITQTEYNQTISVINSFIENHKKSSNVGLALDSSVYRGTGDSQTPAATKKWDMELLSSAVTSQATIAKAIERCNREIARVLGVEQLLLGDGDSGSHALSKDKTQSLFLIVGSTLKEMAECYERDLLDPLWKMNGFDPELKPSLKAEEITHRDMGEMAASLRDIAAAGVPLEPGDEAVKEYFAMLGLTPPDRDEEDMGGDPLDASPDKEDPGLEENQQ